MRCLWIILERVGGSTYTCGISITAAGPAIGKIVCKTLTRRARADELVKIIAIPGAVSTMGTDSTNRTRIFPARRVSRPCFPPTIQAKTKKFITML